MMRVGNVFTLYSKINQWDAWTQRGQFTRNDFASTILLGIGCATNIINDNYIASAEWIRFSVGGFDTTSPIIESPWMAIDQNTFDVATPIVLLENKIAAFMGITLVGNIKGQQAFNFGVYNGTWLTLSALLIALQGQAIIDKNNSYRTKFQFNSNGSQAVDISGIGSFLEASGVAAGGGGSVTRSNIF